MNNGWIKLHRVRLEWEWYDDHNTSRLFVHLLLHVNHKDKHWRGKDVKAGQKITSYAKLAEQTKMSLQNVRTSLNKLKSTGELTIKTTSKYTLIQLNNWEKYQDTNTPPNNLLTINQHTTNNKQECKNEKNVIIYSETNKKQTPYKDFDKFKMNDGTTAIMRYDYWCGDREPYPKIDRSHYKECPPNNK